jgi:hypothetical protein
MNIYWIYDLPNSLFALLCIGFFILITVGGFFLFRGFISKHILRGESHNDIVSSIMSSLNALFSITLGLIAIGAWENFNSVDSNVSQEAAVLSALYQNVKSIPSPLGDTLRAELREYARHTIEEAWPLQQKGIVPHGGTERLMRFQSSIMQFTPTTKGENFIFENALNQLARVVELRRFRLQNVSQGFPSSIWLVILVGCLINIVILWLFKAESPRMHIVLMTLFASLLGLLVFLTAAMDNPFRGEFSVSPDAFQIVFDNMKG